jgi:hypothetical protein
MYVALVGCWSVASVGAVQRQVWSRGQSRSDCLRCGPSPLTQSGHLPSEAIMPYARGTPSSKPS